jgi:hypothetical protein
VQLKLLIRAPLADLHKLPLYLQLNYYYQAGLFQEDLDKVAELQFVAKLVILLIIGRSCVRNLRGRNLE